jgi:hypothetical protein
MPEDIVPSRSTGGTRAISLVPMKKYFTIRRNSKTRDSPSPTSSPSASSSSIPNMVGHTDSWSGKTNLSDTVFVDGKLGAGSIVRVAEYSLMARCTRAVVYCFRSFTTPSELLEMLKKISSSSQLQEWQSDLLALEVRTRVTAMLLEWVNIAFFVDFQTDPKLVSALHGLLESLLPPAEHNRVKLALLRAKLNPHNLRFPDDKDTFTGSSEELVQQARYLLQQDPVMVSSELTQIDFELYRAIEATELLDKNWSRKGAEQLSPNLVELRKRFNQLSFWVITVVLQAPEKKEQQIKVISQMKLFFFVLKILRSFVAFCWKLLGICINRDRITAWERF